MKVLDNFIFFSEASAAGESNVLSNPNLGSQIIIQAGGTATNIDIQILGQTDINADFVPLSCINMTTFDVDSKITAAGIYAVPVDGVCKIKAKVNAAADVLGKEADDSTKATVYGARALASAKVGSVGATANGGIEISGTATVPTVGIKLDPAAGNAASLSAAGLLVTVPAAAEYTIAKLTTAETGYLATYQLQKDGTGVGEKINIPKDYLVKSAAVKTSTGTGDPSGFDAGVKYIDFTINTYDTQTGSGTESHIYLNVADLVDVYESGSAAGDAVKIAISTDNKISATVTDKGITLAMLADDVQTSLGKANSALQKASITTGTANGTIAVGGTDVAVKGLGSAAYAATTDFDSAGAAAGVLGSNADAAGDATVYGANKAAAAAQAKADSNATEIAKKIDATSVSAIGKSGNINDAIQTAGDYIVFNCGSSNTVI